MSDVNYFFSLTTIISPDQRQLLFDSCGAKRHLPGGGRSPPGGPRFLFWDEEMAVGKWETCFLVFHFSIRLVAGAVEMWESRLFLARFPRACGNRGKEGIKHFV